MVLNGPLMADNRQVVLYAVFNNNLTLVDRFYI